jgi:hypothetical protein
VIEVGRTAPEPRRGRASNDGERRYGCALVVDVVVLVGVTVVAVVDVVVLVDVVVGSQASAWVTSQPSPIPVSGSQQLRKPASILLAS